MQDDYLSWIKLCLELDCSITVDVDAAIDDACATLPIKKRIELLKVTLLNPKLIFHQFLVQLLVTSAKRKYDEDSKLSKAKLRLVKGKLEYTYVYNDDSSMTHYNY